MSNRSPAGFPGEASRVPVEGAICAPVMAAYCQRVSSPAACSAWDATALRAGSTAAREVVARQASDLRYGAETIAALAAQVAASNPSGGVLELWRRLHTPHLRRLARLIAVQSIDATGARLALDIYRGLYRAHGKGSLPKRHLVMAAELAFFLRESRLSAELCSLLPRQYEECHHLRCDLLNPFVDSPNADSTKWLAMFNRYFDHSGVEQVQLRDVMEDNSELPFDRLIADVPAASVTGPLITVVMTSWCPDHTLETALDSLLSQSWANLEVLLVDDASPASFDPLLLRAAGRDPRVRLIKQEVNQGTYVARNRGLAEANGAFFTVHDSDDWAHPRRLELQVKPLLDNQQLVATHCRGLRTSEALLFNLPGVAPTRVNESSLLFRTQVVRDRIGYYDPSRKGADSEYSIRLRHGLGLDSYRALEEVLTVIRLGSGSLSRAEFTPGWRHPARSVYRRAFEAWHLREMFEGPGLYLDPHAQRRKFALPTRFKVDQGCQRDSKPYDYLIISDFTSNSPLNGIVRDELFELGASGERVAILHLNSFLRPSLAAVSPYCPNIQAAIDRGVVDEVLSTDSLSARRLIVMDPALMQFTTNERSNIDVVEAFIVAPHGMVSLDGLASYDPRICELTISRRFGCAPRWIARDALARRQLVPVVPARSLASRSWPAAVHPPAWKAPGGRSAGGLGRVALELDARRSIEEQVAMYGKLTGAPASVWLGHRDGSESPPSALPPPWVLQPASIEKATLMALSDAWLHLAPVSTGSAPLGVLQAMASGCLVVMHDSWEAKLGGAALYVDALITPRELSVLLNDHAAVQAARVAAGIMVGCPQRKSFAQRVDAVVADYPP